jgi:hypothetical protein
MNCPSKDNELLIKCCANFGVCSFGWRVAHVANTSLDGNPTLWQRLKISYLRNFKHLIIENKSVPTKFSDFIKGVLKLFLAAFFSGAVLIYFVNLAIKPKTTETETQLKELNQNLETVSKQLDKISDSKTKQILRSIEKHK